MLKSTPMGPVAVVYTAEGLPERPGVVCDARPRFRSSGRYTLIERLDRCRKLDLCRNGIFLKSDKIGQKFRGGSQVAARQFVQKPFVQTSAELPQDPDSHRDHCQSKQNVHQKPYAAERVPDIDSEK